VRNRLFRLRWIARSINSRLISSTWRILKSRRTCSRIDTGFHSRSANRLLLVHNVKRFVISGRGLWLNCQRLIVCMQTLIVADLIIQACWLFTFRTIFWHFRFYYERTRREKRRGLRICYSRDTRARMSSFDPLIKFSINFFDPEYSLITRSVAVIREVPRAKSQTSDDTASWD